MQDQQLKQIQLIMFKRKKEELPLQIIHVQQIQQRVILQRQELKVIQGPEQVHKAEVIQDPAIAQLQKPALTIQNQEL